MQLLDRYLNAVRFWLPAAQQDDIVAELGDDLRAEITDRESDLGRALNNDEISAILKRRGDPVLVAGNFVDHRPLVGPALLPLYWFIVKLVTLWVLIPVCLLIVGPIEVARSTSVGGAWTETVWNLFMGQVFAFGIITIVFMCLERSKAFKGALEKSADDFNPNRLPALAVDIARQAKATPRSVAIAEIVSSIVVTLIWLAALWGSAEIRIDDITFTPAPIWMIIRWAVLGVCLGSIGLGGYSLAKPYAIRSRDVTQLVIDGVNLAVAIALLIANNWITIESVKLSPDALSAANYWANLGIRIALGIAVAVTGFALEESARRLLRRRREGAVSLLHTA